MDRRQGSILIMSLILTLLVGGITAALLATAFTYHRISREVLNREQAYRAAESGAGYYMVQMATQPTYFLLNPAPHAEMTMGSSSYRLESARPAGPGAYWEVLLRGLCDGVPYRLHAIIGNRRIAIPDGILAVGTGNPSNVVLRIHGGSRIGSYDPAEGAYDPLEPGEDSGIAARGSLRVQGSSRVHGDATVTGDVTVDNSSLITGTETEGAPEIAVEDIDAIVKEAMTSSRTQNQNALLTGVFGLQWTPVLDGENYGDLIITKSGTYVIPAGTYRFRRFEVRSGATVVFDTSLGPAQLIYVGSGAGTGDHNDLTVSGGAAVKVSPGGTAHGLLTVLGPDCDFVISGDSIFGQATGDAVNGGFTQIISLGGNASSDDVKVSGGSRVYGRLYAASHTFSLDGSAWYGSALVRTVDMKGSTFAVDLGSVGGTLVDPTAYELLARWPGAH